MWKTNDNTMLKEFFDVVKKNLNKILITIKKLDEKGQNVIEQKAMEA
jgi:uncharacterized protein YnzC (UPF0291/DUF896 family)